MILFFIFRQPLADKGNDVVIVGIDEESMKKVGNWPWPRERLAKLIGDIKKGKPKVIGVDFLLDIPAERMKAWRRRLRFLR